MTQTATRESAHDSATWWRNAVTYQIYPRSFADSNGDGIGDLVGITSRVPYLTELGIDAVWLSPFYPSALADGGYDVDDYRNVDPRIGTLADFDVMTQALHDAGIKLVVDIVPNHSSDQHRWFKEAVAAGKGSLERERYIFRDGRGKDGELPPSTWPAMFGGIVWERITEPDGTPGQWYFHTFAKEQPDWNWKHPDVHAEFLETLRFWADRGVDGFRIDVAHGLAKNLDPAYDVIKDPGEPGEFFEDGKHPTTDRDEVHEIYKEWRALFNQYEPPRFAVAEAWVPDHRRAPYASTDELGQAFNFDLLLARFDASEFKKVVTSNLEDAERFGSSSTWVLSNHDVVRHATRYGIPESENPTRSHTTGNDWLMAGGDLATIDAAGGLRRAQAATLFIMGLPGSVYLYQGEELGLQEVGDLPATTRQDPAYFRSEGREVGRDGCRVPLPWSATGNTFGFSADDAASHLPQPSWYAQRSVEAEREDQESTLSLYRRALALRHQLVSDEQLEWIDSEAGVLHFARPGGWHVVTNFNAAPVKLPSGDVLVASNQCGDSLERGVLPGHTTVWLEA
ncbi:glycoside hydrolase family 13 protein [Changpingibacter yushuensis]|uniref:glycoside hydrolase family 13 protein n=1 Tax=Changpingibacter yushuensis TaxID=2758440 RepID=UPI0015F4AACA|nr:glycoside hydrolase family 13 protein [Changpingibacter yushuensis]